MNLCTPSQARTAEKQSRLSTSGRPSGATLLGALVIPCELNQMTALN